MKVIIAGTRTFTEDFYRIILEKCILKIDTKISEIICGEAKGIDALGKKYAEDNGIKVVSFFPNWKLGKFAGILRNKEMGDYADCLIAITSGSPGTKNMINYMEKLSKPSIIYNSHTKKITINRSINLDLF